MDFLPDISEFLLYVDEELLPRKRRRDSYNEFELKAQALELIDLPDPQLHDQLHAQLQLGRESTRHTLAMVWILRNCELLPTSVVPRNRVYSRFVQYCAQYKILPLTSASLGKLVKFLFPQLTIRRLGVRGQAKYHFCGIKVKNDDLADIDVAHVARGAGLPIRDRFDKLSVVIPKYQFYPDLLVQLTCKNVAITLPAIYPYIPADCEVDIADILYSLYKINCSIVVESIRELKLNRLFANFVNFNTVLTLPIFKLYVHESLYGWIKACDGLLYARILRMLAANFMHYHPPSVLQILHKLVAEYTTKMCGPLTDKLPPDLFGLKLKQANWFIDMVQTFIHLIEALESFYSIKQTVIDDLRAHFMALDYQELIGQLPLPEVVQKNILSFTGYLLTASFDFFSFQNALNILFEHPVNLRYFKSHFWGVLRRVLRHFHQHKNFQLAAKLCFWFQDFLVYYWQICALVGKNFADAQEEAETPTAAGNIDLLYMERGYKEHTLERHDPDDPDDPDPKFEFGEFFDRDFEGRDAVFEFLQDLDSLGDEDLEGSQGGREDEPLREGLLV